MESFGGDDRAEDVVLSIDGGDKPAISVQISGVGVPDDTGSVWRAVPEPGRRGEAVVSCELGLMSGVSNFAGSARLNVKGSTLFQLLGGYNAFGERDRLDLLLGESVMTMGVGVGDRRSTFVMSGCNCFPSPGIRGSKTSLAGLAC